MSRMKARNCMCAALVACIAKYFNPLPDIVKIEKKDAVTTIILMEYGVFIYFFVTDSLSVSYRTYIGGERSNIPLIAYEPDRSERDLNALVEAAVVEVVNKTSRH